jgi:5-methyltetrahydrofolate--homocysteine methyltransferase
VLGLAELRDAVIAGRLRDIPAMTADAVAGGLAPRDLLERALIPAMDEVGRRMRDGEYYVPEVLVAAKTMQAAVDVLKPLLAEGQALVRGRVLFGTVKGDLHDVGKNLVAMMLEGSGFAVTDLGINVPPERFVAAVREEKPDLLALSAMLTTTMEAMRATVDALVAAGLREQVKVLVGGAPVTREFAMEIGADGYAADGARAVELAKTILRAT